MIILKEDTQLLLGVTVFGKKPLIEQDGEKMIVDAQQLVKFSVNLYDVVKRTPTVVAVNDGIYLGSSPAMIYINGVEQRMNSAEIVALLKNMPASMVEKIEVIHVASAKYDAASTGGIINIILKKGVKIGLNGSSSIGFTQGRFNDTHISSSLYYNNSSISSYFSANYTNSNNFNDDSITNKVFELSSAQKDYEKIKGNSFYTGFGFGKTITKNKYFNYDGNFTYSNTNSTTNGENYSYRDKINVNPIVSRNDLNSNLRGTQHTISYKNKIDTVGSDWTSSFTLNHTNAKRKQEFLINNTVINNFDNSATSILAQTDLNYQLREKWKLETGLKSSYLNFNNSKVGGDAITSNRYNYQEAILGGYLMMSKQIKKVTLRGGLRVEYTDMTGVQKVPRDTNFSVNRLNYFPYLHISLPLYKFNGSEVKANVMSNSGITRPTFEQLNPVSLVLSPMNTQVGNPSLKPQYTQTYEFSLSSMGFPFLAVGHNKSANIISEVYSLDRENPYRIDKTFNNISDSREFYVRLFIGLPPGTVKNYVFFIGGIFSNLNYQGVYDSKPLNTNIKSYKYFTYHEVTLSKNMSFDLYGYWLVNTQRQFVELSNMGSIGIDLNKYFRNKKVQVSIQFNDLFYSMPYEYQLNQGLISATGSHKSDTQRFGLTLKYNFGGKIDQNKTMEKVSNLQ